MEELEWKQVDCKVEVDSCRDDFALNTKTTCFLCLNQLVGGKEEVNGPEKASGEPAGDWVSLLAICRYLKISARDVVTACRGKGSSEVSDVAMKKLRVTLCTECRLIVLRLSALCTELELLQMKVDDCVRKFSGTLEESEEDVVRVYQFRSLLSEPLEALHRNLAEVLREQMRQKCHERLSSLQPRVTIYKKQKNQATSKTYPKLRDLLTKSEITEKMMPGSANQSDLSNLITLYAPAQDDNPPTIQIPEQTAPSTSSHLWAPSATKRLKCSDCPGTYLNRDSLMDHRRKKHLKGKSVEAEYLCTSCHCKFQRRSDYARHRQYDCPFLPMTGSKTTTAVKSSGGPARKKGILFRVCALCTPPLRLRMSNFGRHKVTHHLDSFFHNYKLPHLTKEDFIRYCRRVLKIAILSCEKLQTAEMRLSYKCQHCENQYTSQGSLSYHLSTTHKAIVGSKLLELQKTSSLAEIMASDSSTISFHHCHRPSEEEPIPSTSEKVHISVSAPKDPQYYFCGLCQPRRKVQVQLRARHNVQFHVETLVGDAKMEGVSPNDFKVYCEHLFHAESIQSRKEQRLDGGYTTIHCSYCERSFTGDKRAMRRHLVLEHKQLICDKLVKLQQNISLEEINDKSVELSSLEEAGSSGWSCGVCAMSFESSQGLTAHKTYGKCLSRKMSSGPRHKCELCDKSFYNSYNLRRHMSQIHGAHPPPSQQIAVQVQDTTSLPPVSNGMMEDDGEFEETMMTEVDIVKTERWSQEESNVVTEAEDTLQETDYPEPEDEYFEYGSNEEEFAMEVPDEDPLQI